MSDQKILIFTNELLEGLLLTIIFSVDIIGCHYYYFKFLF